MIWTWVGADALVGAGPDPGVARGSGRSEGQSPCGKVARVPTDRHDTQSCVEKISAVFAENLHSPAAVIHAADGSFAEPFTSGWWCGFVQLRRSGSPA